MNDAGPAFAAAGLWIIDLDGVVWLTGEPLGDAAGAVALLRARGARVAFATNNSAPTTGTLLARLARIGIEAVASDLVTSARAAASLLEPGQTVRMLAEDGMAEALADRGVRTSEAGPHHAAVVGWSHHFDFATLASTADAARSSGRLVATNVDPTHPTPEGLQPGSGALVAAVATASGVTPEVAGKPHAPLAALLRRQFGFADGADGVVLVGDQPDTDGRLAERLGIPFALVDSGVTAPGTPAGTCPVALRAADLPTLVGRVLDG